MTNTTENTPDLLYSPLTQSTLMIKRARAEDNAAMWLRAAVKAPTEAERHLFTAEAKDAARDANRWDQALIQRIGWSPVGISREWPVQ